MKNRIIALVLVVVMSLLALSSCGSYNFASENLGDYATFDFEGFDAAIKAIQIKDGEFTTNAATRENLVKSKIYNAVVSKIISATKEEDRVETGKLGEGDVLYFTYYAVDEKTGNQYFYSQMAESSLTPSSTSKLPVHSIKLGETNQKDEFLKALYENLVKDADLADYAYSMILKEELQSEAEKAIKAENSEATKEQIDAAKAEAIKVKAGDTIVISVSRSYTKPAEGENPEKPVDEKATYMTITLKEGDALSDEILGAKINNVGDDVQVSAATEEKPDATSKDIKVPIDGIEYTYNVKIEWKVEKAGQPIATFKHTYFKADQNETPDNLREGTSKVNLKDVELTYYVYPVYAVAAPTYENITATDIINHIYTNKITSTTFEFFSDEEFVVDGQKVSDLVAEVEKIFDTKSDKYADGTELKTLLDAYNKADSEDNDKPTQAQKDATTATKKALEDKQQELAKAIVAKIVKATKGSETAEKTIIDEYYESNFHSMKESYDTEIKKNVTTELWKLIDKYVTVDEAAIPAKLIKEFATALYESYEYDYYTGKYNNSTTVTNYDQFSQNGGLDAFLNYKLKTNNSDEVQAALEKQAKAELVPIIKIFVVSKAYEEKAEAVMLSYVEQDEALGMYDVDEQEYIDYYGEDEYKSYYKSAKKSAAKQLKYDKKMAGRFIVDNAYLRSYKGLIGAAAYRQEIKEYGKTNLRVGFQFENLFAYLTRTNLEKPEDHVETKYVTREDGVQYLDFVNITYTIKAEETK